MKDAARAGTVSALKKKEHFIKTKCLFTRQEIILLLEKVCVPLQKGEVYAYTTSLE